MPTEAGQRGAFGFDSDYIINALRNRSVMRGGPRGQSEVIVLISGRRDADVNLLPFGTLGKGKTRGTRKSRQNLSGVDPWEIILFFSFIVLEAILC